MSPWSNLLNDLHLPARSAADARLPVCKRPKSTLRLETLEERVVMSATLFSDTFDTTEFDAANWSLVQNATIDDVGIDEPSAPYAARINGAEGTGDVLQSVTIDLSHETNVTLTFRFQRGGGGNVVEINNDLVLQYRNANGDWVELDRRLGSGTHMQEFGVVTVDLPPEALHADFQFRFMMTGFSTAVDTDDWFVDDVELRSVDAPVGEMFTASQTQTGNLFYPNVLTFNFQDLPAPNGDATLTIRATGDLNSWLENLVLRADGQYIDQLFLAGGVDQGGESTVTLILTQSMLEAWAADGTISFTVTPSSLVNNEGPTSLTLDLCYEQVPVITDTDPPVIQSVNLSDDGTSLVVQLSDDDLAVSSAENLSNYKILQANGDANGDGDPFNDGDETEVAIGSVQYNADTDQLIIQALGQLYGDQFRLVLDGDDAASDGSEGITDIAGNHIAGGDYFSDFDRSVKVEQPTLKDLLVLTDQLDLPGSLQNQISSPVKVAIQLTDQGHSNPRAVAVLLEIYVHRLDRALERGAISQADHDSLVEQTQQVIDGLSRTTVTATFVDHHQHHHRREWKSSVKDHCGRGRHHC